MRSSQHHQKGFTLVEIQIALLLLLMIMAVLMGSLHLVSKTASSAEKLTERNTDLRIVSRLLKQQLAGAVPLRALEDGETKVIFNGASDALYFVGNLPEYVVKGGPWLLHLYQDDAQLVLGYRVLDSQRSIHDNYQDDYETVVLLNDIETIDFNYFDDNAQAWKTSWDDTDAMPRAIKLDIEQTQYKWPELVSPIQGSNAIESQFNIIKMQESSASLGQK
jgi:general secretion pathway protein J